MCGIYYVETWEKNYFACHNLYKNISLGILQLVSQIFFILIYLYTHKPKIPKRRGWYDLREMMPYRINVGCKDFFAIAAKKCSQKNSFMSFTAKQCTNNSVNGMYFVSLLRSRSQTLPTIREKYKLSKIRMRLYFELNIQGASQYIYALWKCLWTAGKCRGYVDTLVQQTIYSRFLFSRSFLYIYLMMVLLAVVVVDYSKGKVAFGLFVSKRISKKIPNQTNEMLRICLCIIQIENMSLHICTIWAIRLTKKS